MPDLLWFVVLVLAGEFAFSALLELWRPDRPGALHLLEPLALLPRQLGRLPREPVGPLQTEWAAGVSGVQPADTAILLAAAHNCAGRPTAGAKYAREAVALLAGQAPRPFSGSDPFTRYAELVRRERWLLAHLVLSDAHAAVGEYGAAVTIVHALLGAAAFPELLWAVIAWYSFLAGDLAMARLALYAVIASTQRAGRRPRLGAKYAFMTAYLRYRLLGEDSRPALQQDRAQVAHWADDARRLAEHPYGARRKHARRDRGIA